MQDFLTNRLQRSDYVVAAIYWVLALIFILPVYVAGYGWPRAVAAMSYNIVLDTAMVFWLVFGLLPRFTEVHRLAYGLLLALAALVLSGALYRVGYNFILDEYSPLTLHSFLSAIINHGRSYGILAVLLIGKSYFDGQRRLLLAQKAQAESELKSLRAQIDPHFLFNNLNILYALIQHNQQEASHFLSCFSSLYRYLIRHKDADFVSLEEELRFADEYIYLLQHRFGKAYSFHKALPPGPVDTGSLLLVPGTLQVLIENVIKHNRGDEDAPLLVVIEIRADELAVRNKIAPKRTPVESTGTGLHNLQERYKLLSGRGLHIYRHDFFEVTVPVLRPQPR